MAIGACFVDAHEIPASLFAVDGNGWGIVLSEHSIAWVKCVISFNQCFVLMLLDYRVGVRGILEAMVEDNTSYGSVPFLHSIPCISLLDLLFCNGFFLVSRCFFLFGQVIMRSGN